jgi:hypothetical protein
MNYERKDSQRSRRVGRLASALLAGLMVAGSSLAFGAVAANAAPGDAMVTVIHGIPNTPVDVYVDDAAAAGAPALPNFQPGTVTAPIALAPGPHQVTIFAAGTKVSPVLNVSETLTANENVSLIANLDGAGAPALSAFVNDVSMIPAGQARLVVRHTAAAPAVDVRADGAVAFPNLVNGQQAAADLAPGTISADVVLAGTPTVVIGPAPLTLTAGTETIVYAIGSATANPNTLGLVVQTITGLGTPGASVNTGGVVQSSDSTTQLIAGGVGLAGVVGVVFAIVLYRRQRQSA